MLGEYGYCGLFNAKFQCRVHTQQTFEELANILKNILKEICGFYSKKDRCVELDISNLLPTFPIVDCTSQLGVMDDMVTLWHQNLKEPFGLSMVAMFLESSVTQGIVFYFSTSGKRGSL